MSYFVCILLGFNLGVLVCYVFMQRELGILRKRIKNLSESQDLVTLLEEAVKSSKSKDEIASLLLYHSLAQKAESRFLGLVAAVKLKELGEEPSCADTESGADDRESGERESSS